MKEKRWVVTIFLCLVENKTRWKEERWGSIFSQSPQNIISPNQRENLQEWLAPSDQPIWYSLFFRLLKMGLFEKVVPKKSEVVIWKSAVWNRFTKRVIDKNFISQHHQKKLKGFGTHTMTVHHFRETQNPFDRLASVNKRNWLTQIYP